MAYISGTITENSKIIVLDSNHNKITSSDVICGPSNFVYNLDGIDRYSYTINNLTSTSGTVIAVSNEGEISGYQTMSYISDVDSYTKLLLHFNESPLVDTTGKTLTLNGSIVRSATQSKFGSYSGYFNGTSQNISIADSSDWNFGSGEFTIDFWYYTSNGNNVSQPVITHNTSGSPPNAGFSFGFGTQSGRNVVQALLFNSGGMTICQDPNFNVIGNINAWHHVAYVRSGNNLLTFYDGVLKNTQALGAGYTIGNASGQPVYIGYRTGYYGTTDYSNFYLDELRVSKGIARWISSFTPPMSAYI